MTLRRRILIGYLVLALSAITTITQAAIDDSLTIGTTVAYEGLNPLTQSTSTPLYMILMVNRPLILLQPDMKWHAEVIKEIPSLKNKMIKKKGTGAEMTIEILPKAQWGDGEPLTCKDLAFTLKVGMSKNVSVPDRSKYENISEIQTDKKNPKKCTIFFKVARYDNVTNLPDILPAHLEGPIFEKYGSELQGYDKNSLYAANPTNPGLYLGPYLPAEVKLGSHVVLKANPKFYGTAPKIKTIIVKEIPNAMALEAHLRSKAIDMAPSWGGFGLDQATQFEQKTKADQLPYVVAFAEGLVYMHIDVNLDHPILREVKVRKALMYGLNRKLMIESLLNNRARLAHHFAFEQDPWFAEDVTKYDYDFKKANQLLDQAGWLKDKNGLRSKDGKPLSISLAAIGGSKATETLQAFIQQQWRSIGVDLKIKNEAARVLYGEVLPQRKYDLAFYSWLSTPESSPRGQLVSSNIPNQANAYAGQNYTGYKNSEVDQLIEKLEVELSAERRAEIGKKIVRAYAEELPVLPMYFRSTNAVVPKKLKNFVAAGSMYPETIGVEHWSF